MSRYDSETTARFDQQFAETKGERNARLRAKRLANNQEDTGRARALTDAEAPSLPREWRGEKIITTHVYPPIPDRSMDWSAVTENYDAECDDGVWRSSSPHGTGPTEAAAIAGLIEQLEEREP